MKERPGYYAILTANVRYDERLTLMQKIMYAEITALSNKFKYCNASNKYFADLYQCSTSTISKSVSNLETCGYVKVELIKNEEGTIRRIYPLDPVVNNSGGASNELLTGVVTSYSYNNTSINNTSIEREREQFTEVMRYYRAKVNNRWEVSSNGKYRKRLSDLIHQGRAISDIKKVIDHRFAELENGLPQYLVEPDNIFKHDLFLKTLNAANFKPAQKPKAVNGKNSGIQLAGEEGFKDMPSGWENYGI